MKATCFIAVCLLVVLLQILQTSTARVRAKDGNSFNNVFLTQY